MTAHPSPAPHQPGGTMNITSCTVRDCHAERAGLAMCARHLWTWAMRHDEKAAA
jgi:hypothetical protein